jgi:transposase
MASLRQTFSRIKSKLRAVKPDSPLPVGGPVRPTAEPLALESNPAGSKSELARLADENARLTAENLALRRELATAKSETARLADENAELKRRVGMDSANSSKPPSSDPTWRRRQSCRDRGVRKPGGQPGHPGHTLAQVAKPDYTLNHVPDVCRDCGCGLAGVEVSGQAETRQEFDLPENIKLEVTAHASHSKRCPRCGKTVKAAFPPGVDAPAVYGPRIKSVAVCFSAHHHIPALRTAEALNDLAKADISAGTVMSFVREAAKLAAPAMDKVKDAIAASPHAHFDETGCRFGKASAWMHVAATETMADFHFHVGRGKEAMDEFGILSRFTGIASHDFWKSYESYPNVDLHNPCRAHLIRELINLAENAGNQEWALEMRKFLVSAKAAADDASGQGLAAVPHSQAAALTRKYRRILTRGMDANSLTKKKLVRGTLETKAATRAKNLIKRLVDYEDGVLLNINNTSVPFDNNEAERAIRTFKIKMKVSGCFRSEWGGKACAVLRGYIWTARKNAVGAVDALRLAFAGRPYVPPAARGQHA